MILWKDKFKLPLTNKYNKNDIYDMTFCLFVPYIIQLATHTFLYSTYSL